jgi:hypothetical protein
VQLDDEGALNVFSQKHNKWHNYKFDRAFGEDSSQNDVYAETQPLIRSVLDGEQQKGWPTASLAVVHVRVPCSMVAAKSWTPTFMVAWVSVNWLNRCIPRRGTAVRV